MGFNTLAESEFIPTMKDNEFAKVQVVHVTPDVKFPNAKERVQIEVRLYFEGNRGMTPTKTALVFDSPEDVTELASALADVAEVFTNPSIQALIPKPAPVAAPAAPVVRKLGAKAPARNGKPAAAAPVPAAKPPVRRKRPVGAGG